MKLKTTKLSYCENRDGHLGFGPCTATIIGAEQLHLDHVDGNRYNNDPSNIRTYCANCHSTKTVRHKNHLNMDFAPHLQNEFPTRNVSLTIW